MKEPATQTKTPEAAPMDAAPQQKTVFSSRQSAHPLVRLQRTIGNQGVQRYIQAKLVVGAANDEFEQEAERVAEQVVKMPASPLPDSVSIQRRASAEAEIAFEPGSDFEARLSTSGSGSPLPASTRAFMESRFGADFSGVRLHTGSEATQLNRSIGAEAFTHGSDIYAGEGLNNLESTPGKHLLAHELTHTIQQGAAGIVTSGRTDLVGRLQSGIGNVARAMSGLVQRSWIGDRIDWVRTAIRDDNWTASDPPGAYYVLNGLSMDDMVRVLRALTPTDRKKLSDNLNEHAAGFDRSRLQLALANAATAPDASIEVTNDPTLTPPKLKAMGYRFKDNFGGVPKWVHPSGKELWLQSPSKATSQAPPSPPGGIPPNPSPPTHPDIQGAREWGDNLEARRNELWEEAIRLKQMRNPNGSYPMGPINEYYKKLNKFDKDRTSVLEEEAPLWKAALLNEDEKKELEQQLERIKKLNDYPPEMEDLGTP